MIDDAIDPRAPAAPDEAPIEPPPRARGRDPQGDPAMPSRALTAGLLALILLAGGWLRFSGADWDAGHHLHPDERFLTMVGGSLALPQDLLGYLDTDTSPLNPRNRGHNFFSYGTWPVTLTYLAADAIEGLRSAPGPEGTPATDGWRRVLFAGVPGLTSYGGIYLVGRALSALLDLLTVLLVFATAALLYDRRVGLLAAAMLAFTAFHIQQAHFYTVDAPLAAFVMLALFGLALAVRGGYFGHIAGLVVAGLGLGMALASKVSVWPLVPVAVVVLAVCHADARRWRAGWWRGWLVAVALLGLVSLGTLKMAQPDMFAGPGWPNVVANPARLADVTVGSWVAPRWWVGLRAVMPDALEMYLLPDPRWANSMQRIKDQVTGFGMDWPPNHQWWGRKAYLFPLANMVRFGMGWPLGLAVIAGWLAAGLAAARGDRRHLAPWLWITAYFGFQGLQWAKTMRYYLPLYGALAMLAAWLLVAWYDAARRGAAPPALAALGRRIDLGAAARGLRLARPRAALAAAAVVVAGTALWGLMFHAIYRSDHSRVAASEWVYHNLETAFAVRTTRIDPALSHSLRGPWLPALPAGELTFTGTTWTVPDDGAWIGPMRLLVPGAPAPAEAPGDAPGGADAAPPTRASSVTADAVRLAFVSDPADDAAPERVTALLSTRAFLDAAGAPDGAIARGAAEVAADGPDGPHAIVAFDAPVELAAGGEYYLWLRVEGAPLAGRPATLAYETHWDDIVPIGIDGYGGYDDAGTAWSEGLFGVAEYEMYGEDAPNWLPDTLAALPRTDYWISTSNRVYGAVAQLPMRFPATIAFYRDALFGEGYGFRHRASITSYPRLGPLVVPDQAAEEAFHVYDHPKVDIFAVPRAGDFSALRADLEAAAATRNWPGFPPPADTLGGRLLDALLGRIPVGRVPGAASAPAPAAAAAAGDPRAERDPILLDPAQAAAQRGGGTWSERFDAHGVLARVPLLAALVWYLALAVLGVLAFPLVAVALPGLADRGWSVARIAGLLIVAWLGWLAASLRIAPHTGALLLACVAALGAASAAATVVARFDAVGWMRAHRRRLLGVEAVMLALYLVFLAIKAANPDLWHSNFGGEKPMDLAYFQAVLRSTYFPPYDPWFAGGRMNYYYFGFVLVGTLTQLTRIVPWIAYNLAIASLAAMTGTAAYGLAVNWLTAAGRGARAERAGWVAAFLAVLSGNLYQLPFILGHLAAVAPAGLPSHLPGVAFASRVVEGAWAVLRGQAALRATYEHHWYWNASRAIPSVVNDTQPITEFPFFTFLYGDLHAHMMAMPIALLAFTVALAWAFPAAGGRTWRLGSGLGAAAAAVGAAPGALGRLALGALAIGALWPTNTWDVPSFGLLAAGALLVGAARRAGAATAHDASARPRRARAALVALGRVGAAGLALLALAVALFWPYHATYVAPYRDFAAWRGYRTPPTAYLVVHGLLLMPIVSWALLRVWSALGARATRADALRRLLPTVVVAALCAAGMAAWGASVTPADLFPAPSPWTPAMVCALAALGFTLLTLPGADAPDRLAGGTLLLGAVLTGFVENVVLAGDIGRMNTVFKFYIHVWLLWSVTAGYAAGRVVDALGATRARRVWTGAFAALLAVGLLYTLTATRAKAIDRFPPPYDLDPAARATWDANWRTGLDGSDFLRYAVYEDTDSLHLAHDAAAFAYLRDQVRGTPVVLEGFRPHYKWGARYSIWTGLPTVIGWDWHQKQQRNGGQAWLVDDRARDVARAYDTTDDEEALALLDLYDVEIVVVGELEHMLYDPAGLAKFARWAESGRAERIFANEGVTLYRLPRGDAAADEAPDAPAGRDATGAARSDR